MKRIETHEELVVGKVYTNGNYKVKLEYVKSNSDTLFFKQISGNLFSSDEDGLCPFSHHSIIYSGLYEHE